MRIKNNDYLNQLETVILDQLRLIGSFRGKKVIFFESSPIISQNQLSGRELVRTVYMRKEEIYITSPLKEFSRKVRVINKDIENYIKNLELDGTKKQTESIQKLINNLLKARKTLEQIKEQAAGKEQVVLDKQVRKLDVYLNSLQKKIDHQFYKNKLFFEFKDTTQGSPFPYKGFICRRKDSKGEIIASLDKEGLKFSETCTAPEVSQIVKDAFSKRIPLEQLIINRDYRTLELLLISGRYNVNHPDANGNFLLNFAIAKEDLEAVQILLRYKANPSNADSNGNTGLHFAACVRNVEILALLISTGAEIDQVNKYGATPLVIALELLNREGVKKLVEAGANINVESSTGINSLYVAALMGDLELVKLLKEKGAKADFITTTGSLPAMLTMKPEVRTELAVTPGLEFEMRVLEDYIQANRFGVYVDGTFKSQTFSFIGFPSESVDFLSGRLFQTLLLFVHHNRAQFRNPDETIQTISQALKPLKARNLYQEYQTGKPVMFLSRWKGHAICHLFVGEYYIQANRGERDVTIPGFHIYKMGEALSPEILERMVDDSSMDFHTKGLREILKLKYCTVVPQSEQVYGNCSFVSFKSGIYAFLLFTLLQQENLLILPDHLNPEQEEDEEFQQAFAKFTHQAHLLFKGWARFDRDHSVNFLLDSYQTVSQDSDYPPNLKMLQFILAKFKGKPETVERIVQFLLSRNADWNSVNQEGVTFIQALLNSKNYSLLKLLVRVGALEEIEVGNLNPGDLTLVQKYSQ